MDWDDIRFFLAIARASTLSGAARELNVSQPTVSRRLAAMERGFGVKLFDRTADGYEVSSPGADILETAKHVEEELNSIDRKVFGQDWRLCGNLRITCTEVLANEYLPTHLHKFLNEHPDIDLSIVCTFQHLSLSRREADVAIRMTSQPPDTLIGRRLMKAAMGVYTAKDNVIDGTPAGWEWIGWQDEAYNRAFITTPFPQAQIRHRADDMQTMRSMARAGLGVVTLPAYMADADPSMRRVIDETIVETAPDIWVLTHPDVRRMARVRIFADFISKAIIADRDLFEGRRPLVT
jgi:DNA-binding transcriptional LysR family regulator